MRRSSQIGFGISIGLAILSASFVSGISADQNLTSLLSEARAGVTHAAATIIYPSEISERAELPAKFLRQDFVGRVHQKLIHREKVFIRTSFERERRYD